MRSLLLLSIFFSTLLNLRADDGLIGWRLSNFKESSYRFKITRAAIDKAPKWESNDEYPPLSPRKAFQIALAQARQLRPEVSNWNNSEIRLTPIRTNCEKDKLNAEWIYMITLQDFSGPIFGTPWQLNIPVYFDGSTITPVIEKSKRYKAEQGAGANP
jgi:hypothetical protein